MLSKALGVMNLKLTGSSLIEVNPFREAVTINSNSLHTITQWLKVLITHDIYKINNINMIYNVHDIIDLCHTIKIDVLYEGRFKTSFHITLVSLQSKDQVKLYIQQINN